MQQKTRYVVKNTYICKFVKDMLLTDIYTNSQIVAQIDSLLAAGRDRIHATGMTGSLSAAVAAAMALQQPDRSQLIITGNKEEAYYLLNDIEMMLDEADADLEQKRALLFPSSLRKPRKKAAQGETAPDRPVAVDDDGGDLFATDNANILQRSEVVKQLNSGRCLTVVTYPEALFEKVVSSRTLTRNTLRIAKGAQIEIDFIIDVLQDYGFERVDFVYEPGQFAIRGYVLDKKRMENGTFLLSLLTSHLSLLTFHYVPGVSESQSGCLPLFWPAASRVVSGFLLWKEDACRRVL